MRDFNKVSPTVWRSQKFRKLPTMEARHVYLYLLTSPHSNSSGCYDLHPMYAAADLGMTEEGFAKALGSLSQAGLVRFDEAENTVWMENWDEFNVPTNPKHALGLLTQLNQASSETLKALAFHAFLPRLRAKGFDKDASLKKAIESLLKAFPEPICTRPDQTEMETERETRPDQTKTETRESSRPALRVALAEGQGDLAPSVVSIPGAGSPIVEHLKRKGAFQ